MLTHRSRSTNGDGAGILEEDLNRAHLDFVHFFFLLCWFCCFSLR